MGEENPKQHRVFGSVGRNLFSFKDTLSFLEEKKPTEDQESNDTTNEKSVNFQTLDFKTGEENEVNIVKLKCKLYFLDCETKQWIDRGIGEIKINQSIEKKEINRIIFRLEGSLKLLLNSRIIKKIPPIRADSRSIRFCIIEQDKTLLHYMSRFGSETEASDFYDALVNIIEN